MFDPKSGDVRIDWVGVDVDLQRQGIGTRLYKAIIEGVGRSNVKSVSGEMAQANWTAIQAGGINNAPRVKILNSLGYTEHVYDPVTRILISSRPN